MTPTEEGKRDTLAFSSIIYPGQASESNSLLLAESIRDFGGAISSQPIWFFAPRVGTNLSSETESRFEGLDVEIIPFEMDKEVLRFPFTGHAEAAALAESKAMENTRLLAWLAPNTLVLREPSDFLPAHGKQLGYRPVHHKLLGLLYDEPLDSFWELVYNHCEVSESRIFPMKPHVEDEPIKPYFNAGLLIVRPERRLLGTWCNSFLEIYKDPMLFDLYKKDQRYAIFIHQAVLTGVLIASLRRDEMFELPAEYNYPVHLYNEDETKSKPESLENCVTLRHETFHKDPDWAKKLQLSDELKQWISDRLLH